MTLIARFTVDSFEPRQVTGLEADWFGLLTFAKTLTAGITGHATTVFISAGTEEGSRSYVATERITGRTDDGRGGSATIQHGGPESDPGSRFGHIVPGFSIAECPWSASDGRQRRYRHAAPVWRSVRLRRAPPARRGHQHRLLPGPLGVPG